MAGPTSELYEGVKPSAEHERTRVSEDKICGNEVKQISCPRDSKIQDRRELVRTEVGNKKNFRRSLLNGGKNAPYIEPFIKTLEEQLLNKNSSKLIYMLNQWTFIYVS